MSKMATDSEKERFLAEFGDDYGYRNAPKNIDEIRATEFKRLKELVYLDHAGATLYSESQMEAVLQDLNSTVYANPHSQSDCSFNTSNKVAEARQLVLNYFNASPREYSCVFTSGATAALKLVGETFPWSSQSRFMYTMENHNSVLGIREYALNEGATATAVDIEEGGLCPGKSRGQENALKIIPHHDQRRTGTGLVKEELTGDAYNLFAFPSECNFSGLRFNLDLVKIFKEGSGRVSEGCGFSSSVHWMVLIDDAKGCTTKPVNLSEYKADFVVMSFYKLFGYPTGLGALIVRNEAARLMKKTYFSGGTVAASIADIDIVKRREGVEDFLEDGTIPFLSIASIHHGFKFLNSLTISSVSRHTYALATYVRSTLLALRHENGNPLCSLYGANNSNVSRSKMGPIVSFNLKRPDGSWFGYREVEKLASLSGIQLRTGCFCNPGACAKYLGLSHLDLLSNIEAGHVCWDDRDILNGKPTGAVRISFGCMSTFEDAKKFVDFIVRSFVGLPSDSGKLSPLVPRSIMLPGQGDKRASVRCFLTSITIYPIKSCAGFNVNSWPLCSTGLLHDREWVIKSTNGEILTQKKVPAMCYITTLIDLNSGVLFVESPRCREKLQIDLRSNLSVSEREEMDGQSPRCQIQGYDNEVDVWFSNAIGRPCTLIRSSGYANACSNKRSVPGICRNSETRMNFVNEAQFLLISEGSVADLNQRLTSNVKKGSDGQLIQVSAMRFRPNLVISGGEPYEEDGWKSLTIGDKHFASLGGCNRCQMININPGLQSVQKSNEPLNTLAAYRRVKGKIYFGLLLTYDDNTVEGSNSWLQVGQEVHGDTK